MGSALQRAPAELRTNPSSSKVGNNVQKVTFNSGCSSRELNDQLAAVCSLSRGSTILLKDKHGALITVSPAMKPNTAQDAFILDTQTYRQSKYTTIRLLGWFGWEGDTRGGVE
ncbi:hypothetical protein Pcinc_043812 [Petrolisthes cinctipes]|uniref:Uncharacterized protein n=1 Tax=Petrolisthes cinctipes TaxID=88211 RepID=A0AAE1EEX2_PETCI|nr:hypothetical protein Pcinc_043812 [Petrolisthes cinctipes]